jgi:hypothetical protein
MVLEMPFISIKNELSGADGTAIGVYRQQKVN